jgi:2'-5' RNA ligase
MFVAVLPPEHVLEDLEEHVAPRRGQVPFRWTDPAQWHLTLAFLEQVPDRAVDDLVERLASAAARRSPVELRITGGGAFPDPARARVLYAALEADRPDELDRLSAGARAAASTAGAPVDGRRFRPHLTLARLGRPAEATRWIRLLDAYRGPAWTLDEVALVASYLGEGPRGSARHEVVTTLPVGPAGS